MAESFLKAFVTMKRWMENRNAHKSFADYFLAHSYRTVAIYGAGDLGNLLFAELKDSDVTVAYFVDRNYEGLSQIFGIPVVSLESIRDNASVDAMIITPISAIDEIQSDIATVAPELPVISLRDAVFEM